MPHIAISMHPGRDTETKRDIAEKMKQHYVETFGVDDDAVSVSIIEIRPMNLPRPSSSVTVEELYISSRAIH